MRIALLSAKRYDKTFFELANKSLPANSQFSISYFQDTVNKDTIQSLKNFQAIVPFVNDHLRKEHLQFLSKVGVKYIATRSAGFNHIDIKTAKQLGMSVARVPAYSPFSIAEFALGLMLNVNRKLHKAYMRTKDLNFQLDGLLGHDLYKKKVGVIGTGKIGQRFIQICKGIGMEIVCYDKYPCEELKQHYVSLQTLFKESDYISLHCPLTPQTNHLINKDSIALMKKGVIIINTGRGALINAADVIQAVKSHHIGGLGLDVYEQQEEYFFRSVEFEQMKDWNLQTLIGFQNTIVTSHQAFFTKEALSQISSITLNNILTMIQGKCPNLL